MPKKTYKYTAYWSPFARNAAAIALAAAALVGLTLIGPVFTTTILALILAFLLLFPVRLLMDNTRLSYRKAVVIVFLVMMGTISLAAIFIVPSLIRFVATLPNLLAQAVSVIFTDFPDLPNVELAQEATSLVARSLDVVVTTILGIASVAISIFAIAILSLVLLIEAPFWLKTLMSFIPAPHKREYTILFEKAGEAWMGFFKSAAITALIMGGATALQLLIMGIDGALAVGLITTVFSFVPIIGGIIAIVPIIILPLAQGGSWLTSDPLTLTILVVGVNLIIQFAVWQVIQPIVTKGSVNLPVSVIILVVIIGTSIGGILGAFLAVPAVAIGKEVVLFIIEKIKNNDPYPGVPAPKFLEDSVFNKR